MLRFSELGETRRITCHGQRNSQPQLTKYGLPCRRAFDLRGMRDSWFYHHANLSDLSILDQATSPCRWCMFIFTPGSWPCPRWSHGMKISQLHYLLYKVPCSVMISIPSAWHHWLRRANNSREISWSRRLIEKENILMWECVTEF